MNRILSAALALALSCLAAQAQPLTTRPSLIDMLAANCASPRAIIGGAAQPGCSNVALTNPASLATLTLLAGKTLTVNNTVTFTATDGTNVAFGGGGTVAYTSNNLSAFAATTSAQLAGVLSDETGTGLAVFSISPALTGTPTAPTATPGTNTTQLATTAYADAIAALKANVASPTLTGTPAAPTAAVDTNTTQIATTAMVIGQAASATPLIDGSAAVGTSTRFARGDHVHPTDTTRAPLASPALTGAPTAPTAAVDTNTTQLATTAMVLGQAASATPLGDGTAAVGTSTRFARGDHVHPIDTHMGLLVTSITGVNINSANTDNALTITLPTGYTRFEMLRLFVSNCTVVPTTATVGLFTATGAGGAAIVASGSTLSAVTSTADNTNGNSTSLTQALAATTVATSLPTPNTIYLRTQTAQGSPGTCTFAFYYFPFP